MHTGICTNHQSIRPKYLAHYIVRRAGRGFCLHNQIHTDEISAVGERQANIPKLIDDVGDGSPGVGAQRGRQPPIEAPKCTTARLGAIAAS